MSTSMTEATEGQRPSRFPPLDYVTPPPPLTPTIALPSWSVLDRGLGLAAFRTLAVIAAYVDPATGWAEIRMHQMLAAMGLEPKSVRYVQRLLVELENGGHIRRTRGKGLTISRYQVVGTPDE